MDRINLVLIILAIVSFAVVVIPGRDIPVSPTVLFELGTAYHMAGRNAEAKACYRLVLDFEGHFKYKDLHLPKYKQMATQNLQTLHINEVMKNISEKVENLQAKILQLEDCL